MSAIDKLRARYDAQGVRSKVFFEGGDSEIEVFVNPITVEESDKVKRKSKSSDFLYCVYLICEKAKDGEGNKLFPTMKEEQLLRKNVRGEDVAEIAGWIASHDELEGDEKN